MAEATEEDFTKYKDKEPTELQARFAPWLVEKTGYDPAVAKTKQAAFEAGVRLAVALRIPFQASPENREATEARRLAAQEEREALRAEREEARKLAAQEREEAAAAKAEERAARAAAKAEKAQPAEEAPAKPAKATKAVPAATPAKAAAAPARGRRGARPAATGGSTPF